MSVGKYCNREVVFASKTTAISEAARRMREHHVGDLVVVEERSGKRIPIGIVTDRDLVLGVLAEQVDLDKVTVGDVMSFELETTHESDDLLDSVKRMRAKGVRRLPVVASDGALVGILSVDDLIDILTEHLADLVALIGREQRREREQRA
ncbi:MAG: CBS domain-containing protein [Pseudomonadota bacterium]|nr:MAG: CBS domain-containing protein [Pseudomonadota bacterium]